MIFNLGDLCGLDLTLGHPRKGKMAEVRSSLPIRPFSEVVSILVVDFIGRKGSFFVGSRKEFLKLVTWLEGFEMCAAERLLLSGDSAPVLGRRVHGFPSSAVPIPHLQLSAVCSDRNSFFEERRCVSLLAVDLGSEP